MAILTAEQARRWGGEAIAKSIGTRTASQLLTEAAKEKGPFDIFLSHAFVDREVVLGLYAKLRSIGLKVYVDWLDDAELDRTHVTAANADVIRQRITESHTLIYALSTHADQSVWMSWELGFGDGAGKRVAIAPIVLDPKDGSIDGQEYLALYPYVDFAKTAVGDGPHFWVQRRGAESKAERLAAWAGSR